MTKEWRNSLEDGGGIGKAIQHNEVFIVTSGSNECRLPFIAFPDLKVIRAPQVQLGEAACPTEFLECGRDQVKWIREFRHLRVQHAVVNTGPQAPIVLTHEEETRGRRWTGLSDKSLVKSLLDVFLHSLHSGRDSGYTLPLERSFPGSKLMAQSHGRWGGSWVAACLLKTSWNAT